MEIMGPGGRHHGFYRPRWAASWVLQAQVGGTMSFTGPGGQHDEFYAPLWHYGASWLYCQDISPSM